MEPNDHDLHGRELATPADRGGPGVPAPIGLPGLVPAPAPVPSPLDDRRLGDDGR